MMSDTEQINACDFCRMIGLESNDCLWEMLKKYPDAPKPVTAYSIEDRAPYQFIKQDVVLFIERHRLTKQSNYLARLFIIGKFRPITV